MSHTPSPARASWRRRGLIGTMVAALATSVAGLGLVQPAQGAITAPTNGTLVRDEGPITITENRGGQYANIAAATSSDSFLARGCNLNAGTPGTSTRFKANATIRVIRVADNVEVLNKFHQTSNSLLNLAAANATGAFSATWDTTGAEPGLYRIVSTANDRAKVGSGTSQTCTPDTNTVLSDITVEFRPWQHSNFNDLLGHGNVRMNTQPREFQFTLDGTASPVLSATNEEMSFYSAPGGLPELPEDPMACASDPSACLPANTVPCDPTAGCTPRIVLINRGSGPDRLVGVFDLESGAFAAGVATGGKQRTLASAGTDLDAQLSDLLAQSAGNTQALTGLDLLALLNTNVEIRTLLDNGDVQTFEVGVLRGLQFTQQVATSDVVKGINLKAPYVVNAGFIFFQRAATLYPAGTVIDPLTVKKSPLVPNLPTLFSVPLGSGSAEILAPVPVPAPVSEVTGPLLLVGGGPLVNIAGGIPDGSGRYSAGKGTNGPNVDTSPNAPSGLPAWLPGVDQGAMVTDGPVDFVGHAALFLELAPVELPLGLGTLDLGAYLIGQGITVFGDSPLPALGTLPLLWDTENPAAAELNELTSNLALELLTNPAVGQVLAGAFSLLGGGTPDLDAALAVLGDTATFTDLIDTVSGAAGLGAVPGLEDALNAVGVVTEQIPETGGEDPLAWLTALFGG